MNINDNLRSSLVNDRFVLQTKMNDRSIFISMIEKITKGQKTKSEILKKANELFSIKGYESTGVDEIALAANISSGVFYNYFNSKSELLKQVVEIKIERSKELLLVVQHKESANDWILRILKMYLSTEHRDLVHKSCPMTTLSQELVKLNLHNSVGLTAYGKEFAEILNRRLLMISSKNVGLASSVMSLCVGAVQLARLESDSMKSSQILNDAYTTATGLIQKRGTDAG